MSLNFKVSFCGVCVDMSCDDLDSFIFALEENEQLSWNREISARLFHDEVDYNMSEAEQFDDFVMIIFDDPPKSPISIQIRVEMDYSEVPEPADDTMEFWISDLNDLQKAMQTIAPPDRYQFEIAFNDCEITSNEELLAMIAGDAGGDYFVSFKNVKPAEKKVVVVEREEKVIDEEEVVEEDEIPRRSAEPPDEEDGDLLDLDVDGWLDDLPDDVDEPDENAVIENGNGNDDNKEEDDEDFDLGGLWDDFVGDDDEDVGDANGAWNEFAPKIEDEKEPDQPRHRPRQDNGSVLIPEDEDESEATVSKDKPPAAPRDSAPREWDRTKASIEYVANVPNLEEMFTVTMSGDKEEVSVRNNETNEEQTFSIKKDLGKASKLKRLICTDFGAAALVHVLGKKKILRNRSIKPIVGLINRSILEVGTNWWGALVIRAVLMRKVFLKDLVETIRQKCVELVKTPQGALTIQYSLETADVDVMRRPMLLNILLARSKKDKRLNTLVQMAQNKRGSILLQVAMSTMEHNIGHPYVCVVLADLPPEDLLPLCCHPHGYLFMQALLATYFDAEQRPENDDTHDRLWASIKAITEDLARDERGVYVLAAAKRHSSETHRQDITQILDRSGLLESVMSVIKTRGGVENGAPAAAFEGARGLVEGFVAQWDSVSGEGMIEAVGNSLRFYRADLNHGPEPKRGDTVLFSQTGTGTATNIIFKGY